MLKGAPPRREAGVGHLNKQLWFLLEQSYREAAWTGV